MRSSINAEAEAARAHLGQALDEVELRFHPGYITGVSAWMLKRSFRRHPIVWGVVGAAAVTLAIGLVVWAVLSDDEV